MGTHPSYLPIPYRPIIWLNFACFHRCCPAPEILTNPFGWRFDLQIGLSLQSVGWRGEMVKLGQNIQDKGVVLFDSLPVDLEGEGFGKADDIDHPNQA